MFGTWRRRGTLCQGFFFFQWGGGGGGGGDGGNDDDDDDDDNNDKGMGDVSVRKSLKVECFFFLSLPPPPFCRVDYSGRVVRIVPLWFTLCAIPMQLLCVCVCVEGRERGGKDRTNQSIHVFVPLSLGNRTRKVRRKKAISHA